MTVYVTLAVAVCLFAVGLRVAGVVPTARAVLGNANEALRIMRTPDLSDDDKAVAIRAASLGMFGAFFSILARTVAALAFPVLLLAFCIAAGLFDTDQAESASIDWRFIAGSLAVVSAILLVRK